jgi:diacylglycerol kinase family enzyme
MLAGGDGTINKFINLTDGLNVKDVWYYAAGSGNDFWHDIGKAPGDAPICIDQYLKYLPTVVVNDKSYKFINGIGYGIDGYCCEVGDKLKAEGKKVNYTSIAINGLLFHFKARNATVTCDGETTTYKKVWIAPSMNGRFYGGGMMPTPAQDRLNKERTLSYCLMYGKGRIATLAAFPSIFKGEHVKKTKLVKVGSGKEITIEFDQPTAIQIDGETILGVTKYTVYSSTIKKV